VTRCRVNSTVRHCPQIKLRNACARCIDSGVVGAPAPGAIRGEAPLQGVVQRQGQVNQHWPGWLPRSNL
jgi:hypothetical protein